MRARCQISLSPILSNIPLLEQFVENCPCLDGGTKNRAMLIVTEYFDNIIFHSKSFLKGKVRVVVEKRDGIRITIAYRTCNFSTMLKAVSTTAPHFDKISNRYRGLGLLMCSHLSNGIRYKKGLWKSSIIITI